MHRSTVNRHTTRHPPALAGFPVACRHMGHRGAYAPQQQPMPPYNGNAYDAQTPQYVSPMNGNVRPQAPQYPQYPQYAPPAPQYAAQYAPQYAPQYVRRDPLPLSGCDFGQAIKRYWKGYARFSGRASRSEFWYAFLFQWIVGMGASIIPIIGPIVWGCVSLVPGLAIGVRRFHDQNLSGGLYAALYAVGTLASIPTLIGTFGFLAAYGSYEGPELPESGWWTIWMGVGSLMTLVYIIAIAVLMCRPSDPRGVRFDR